MNGTQPEAIVAPVDLVTADQAWLLGLSLPAWTKLAAVVTGSLVGAEFAAKRGFDPVGVFGLAFAQGLGGLVLLELLLLNGTPMFLQDPKYLIGSALASVAGFFFAGLLSRSYPLLMTLDAVSCGFLVCVGVEAGLELQLPLVSAVFLGALTATGGLVLRDVLAGISPTILRPGVLNGAVALLGAVLFTLLFQFTTLPIGIEQVIVVSFVFVLRMLALWRGWKTRTTQDLSDRFWGIWGKREEEVTREWL